MTSTTTASAVNVGVQRGRGLLWLGLTLVLAPLLIRATSTLSLMPGWDMDPLVLGDIRTGLTPAGSLLIDVIVLLGAGLLLVGARALRAGASGASLLLAGVGSIGVVAHAVALGEGVDLGHARVGAAWMSAVWAGVGLWHAARADRRVLSVATGIIGGLLALLALRGAQEWFIEHPRQVAAFTADKDRILASHGWSPGSSSALGFERRLMQREASGWFGLSNVYASLAAGGVVLFIGLLAEAYRRWRQPGAGPSAGVRAALLTALGGAVVAAGALSFAQSKGGLIAAVAGLVALASLLLLRGTVRRARISAGRARVLGGIVGVGAVLGAMALISIRGAVGERLGELSLLFRWFYAQAAGRMFGDHPLWGVGPDGFQAAYALAKNPLSPEEVTSPHILVLDYLAMLGVFGLAWVMLLMRAAWACGAGAVRLPDADDAEPADIDPADRTPMRVLLVVPAIATIGATYLQGVVVTPELAVVRLFGLIAWCTLGWGVLVATRAGAGGRGGVPVTLALGASALGLAAHAQIDVAGSWSQSAGLIAAWIGLGAVGSRPVRRTGDAGGTRSLTFGVLATGVLAGVMTLCTYRAAEWQGHLTAATRALEPVTDLRQRVELLREALQERRPPREGIEQIAADLGATLGSAPPRDEQSFARAMLDLETRLIPAAVEELRKADAADPGDPRARREASRALTRMAEQFRATGRLDAALAALVEAERVLRVDPAVLRPGDQPVDRPSGGEWFALFLVRDRRAEIGTDLAARRASIVALEKAIALDPYNLDLVRRRYRLAKAAGDGAGAASWAGRALELHGLMRLDAGVRGLSPAELAEMRAAVPPATGGS